MWFPYLRRRGLRLNAFIGRPLPRFGALSGRLGRDAGIDGVGRRLPPPEDVGRPTRGRLGREGALGVGLSLTMPGIGLTLPFRPPEPDGLIGEGRGRRGLTVVVFPRPGITKLIFRSFIWN